MDLEDAKNDIVDEIRAAREEIVELLKRAVEALEQIADRGPAV